MKKNKWGSMGVVEISFYANALIVLDEMLKVAEVELVHWEKTLGGRLVSLMIAGDTSAVQAAIDRVVDMGDVVGRENIKIAIAIPNPHPQIVRLMYGNDLKKQDNKEAKKDKANKKEKDIQEEIVDKLDHHKEEL